MIKILSIISIMVAVCSCSNKQYPCEGFNFERLPYDSTYFFKDLYYSNGTDTIKISKVESTFDTISTYGQFGYYAVDCLPAFNVSTKDEAEIFSINYLFDYYPHGDNKLTLSMLVNSCKIEVTLDTLEINSTTNILADKSPNICLGTLSSNWIRNIQLERLRIIMIEKYSGEKWYLIKED